MSNLIHFEVQRGQVVCDCMEETYQFISQNLGYLHEQLLPVRDELLGAGDFTFICHEENWTFAARVDKAELGRVSIGSGIIKDGNSSSYDEVLERLA